MKKTRGFTLIELLVVISIIGLLSSIVLASLNVARAKAMNVRINEDINQYIKAIELARLDLGEYPDPGHIGTNCLGSSYPYGRCGNGYITENNTLNSIMSIYFPAMPGKDSIVKFEGTNRTGYVYMCSVREADVCKGSRLIWFLHDVSGVACGNGGTLVNDSGIGCSVYIGDIILEHDDNDCSLGKPDC